MSVSTVFYLDLEKVNLLNEKERETIMNLYYNMVSYMSQSQVSAVDTLIATLVNAGYLKDSTKELRQTKIDTIIGRSNDTISD